VITPFIGTENRQAVSTLICMKKGRRGRTNERFDSLTLTLPSVYLRPCIEGHQIINVYWKACTPDHMDIVCDL
jgi:hypothetical protein